MTEKELHKIIVSGLDCVKADDSVRARIKKELTGDTMLNNDITMNKGNSDTAEHTNTKIKVNSHGKIIAAAAAIAVFAGGGYLLSHNVSKIPEDNSRPAAVANDLTATDAEDEPKTELTDEERSKRMQEAVDRTADIYRLKYSEEDPQLTLYELDNIHALVVHSSNDSNHKDLLVWDISDPDDMTYDAVTDQPCDHIQLFDSCFAVVNILPGEGSGYEYLTADIYAFDLEYINGWKCQAEDGAYFVPYDESSPDIMIDINDPGEEYLYDLDRVLTYQQTSEGLVKRYYDLNGNMYGENGELMIEDIPEDISADSVLSYSMPRTGNIIILGVNDKGETVIERKFPTADKWSSIAIPSDFEAVQSIFDSDGKTFMFTGTADATGLLYTFDWEKNSYTKKDIAMPSTYVTADAISQGSRFAAMVFDMGNNSSLVIVYDLDKDFAQVFQADVDSSYAEMGVDITIDETTGILSIPVYENGQWNTTKMNIYTGEFIGEETTDIMIPVPDVSGIEEAVAENILKAAEFIPEMTYEYSEDVPNGLVICTEPPAGTDVSVGSNITVVISKGQKTSKGGFISNARQNAANGNAKTVFNAIAEACAELETDSMPMDWNDSTPHWISLSDEVTLPEKADTPEYKQAYVEYAVHQNIGDILDDDSEYLITFDKSGGWFDIKVYWRRSGDDTNIGRYPEAIQNEDEAKAAFEAIKNY